MTSKSRMFWKLTVCLLLILGTSLSSCSTQRAIRLRNKSLDNWQPESTSYHAIDAGKHLAL